ncbi:MAG: glycosyltransferase family 4 protein [Candidatus Omnitrophica bacterium]|nr:glycosyltransferase family 4 protein [Candidatus Omnitrophota bacterium]
MKEKTKHILLFNRSFWPDIEATGQLLTELCQGLAKKYKITVIAGRSYYVSKKDFAIMTFCKREIFEGMEILRVRHTMFWKGNILARIINWGTYGILGFIVALKIRPHLIIACTDPPFLGIMAMMLGKIKSVPFIYNCRDLFPDVAVGLGKIKKNNFLSRIFEYFNKRALNSALAVICLGPAMEDRIRKKGVSANNIMVIPDWADVEKIKPISKSENPFIEKFALKDKFIIMHSGNIGLSQDFTTILKAIKMLDGQGSFYLIFVGEGAGKRVLSERASILGIKNVLFLPYQPKELLSFSLGMADLHLITIMKGLVGAVVPSKIYGIMAAGRPYLVVADRGSEPARFAEEFGCGLWAQPDNLDMITEKINWARSHPKELAEMGERGRGIVETRFAKGFIVNKWLTVLEKLKY